MAKIYTCVNSRPRLALCTDDQCGLHQSLAGVWILGCAGAVILNQALSSRKVGAETLEPTS